MNILITSVGRRTKLVEYFKKHFDKVVVTDCSTMAPAIYFGDKYHLVPRIDSKNYFETILKICKEEEIDGILSLIDPELEMLSSKKEELEKIGVSVIGSPKEVCDICFDKMKMYNFLTENGFKTQKSYDDLKTFKEDLSSARINFPVFVKPITGSASIGICKIEDIDTLELIFNSSKGLMIQQFMDGKELGVDVYTDIHSKEVVSIFAKEKISMRAGETDKAVSIKNERLFELVKSFVEKLGTVGPIDVDVFEVEEEYYISEVNPRFGGGYLIAYECGEKFPKMIYKNLQNEKLRVNIGGYSEGILMMKHDDLRMVR